MVFGLSLESYVGIVISVFMIKAGIEMILSTIDDLIGHRSDPEIVKKIEDLVKEEDPVIGVYDLALFNYGPNKYYCSFHVELPDHMDVDEVDKLTRKMQYKIYKKTGIILIALGVYSYNTRDKEAGEIRRTIERKIVNHDWALQVHGFYIDKNNKSIRFDVILSFDVERDEALKVIEEEISKLYPDYKIQIVPDLDL